MKSSFILKSDVTSVAIGGFDGMHIAHQKLFSNLDKNGAIVVIETGYANLTPNRRRERYSDFPISYYPLEEIKHLSGEQFISMLLEEFPKLQKIVVGFDFCFGANRKHCIEDLKRLFRGEVVVVDEVKIDDIGVHSRVIREYIADGELEFANKLLDKNYTINGHIIAGQGLGKKEFVPTINIDVEGFLLPREGVYITYTVIENKKYNSVSFIGHRKTTDGSFAVETHILDKELDPYNTKDIDISFIKKIRDNQSFESFALLKAQIDDDIQKAEEFFHITK